MRAAAALLAMAAPSPALAHSCTGVTSVSLTAQWAAVDGADVYDVEYVAVGPPPPPAPPTPAPVVLYSCANGVCTPDAVGVELPTCQVACGIPTPTTPVPPLPTPVPPTPTTPPPPVPPPTPMPPPPPPPPPAPGLLYLCEKGKCVADPGGVSLPVCQQNCMPDLVGDGNSTKWPNTPYYTLQTSATPSAVVIDLQPSTRYIFRVRAHQPNPNQLSEGWGKFASHPCWACTTADSPTGAPRGLRRAGGLRSSSFGVAWDPAPSAPSGTQQVSAWDGGAGHRGGWSAAPMVGAPAVSVTVPAGKASAELTGLTPGRVYWVRVGGSDAVPFRTAAAGVRVWENVRTSRTNLADFLSDMNGGDIPADAGFMTVYSTLHGRTDFDNLAMTQYCVESADVDWGDYLSCGNPPDSACKCRNSVDAGYARGRPGCTDKGYDYSKQYPARQPIYGVEPNIPKSAPQLGWWYSTPSKKTLGKSGKTYECPEGAAVGDGGCTWARHPVANTVKGKWLASNGFTMGTRGSRATQISANAKATAATFANFPGPRRCCGC